MELETGAEMEQQTDGGEPMAAGAVPDRGIDTEARRPGVPMETAPEPVAGSGTAIARQPPELCPLTRMGLSVPTPVFGTAQPPRGLSGWLRRAAYRVPEHRPSHWMMLLFADRIDVVEHDVKRLWWLPLAVPVAALAVRAVRARRRPRWRRVLGV